MKIIVVMATVALFAAMCASRAIELRCRCLKTNQRVPYESIKGMEVIPSKPYCPRKEVIITLKNGKEACIDPEGEVYSNLKRQIKSRIRKQSLRNGEPARQTQLFSTSEALQTTPTAATGRQ